MASWVTIVKDKERRSVVCKRTVLFTTCLLSWSRSAEHGFAHRLGVLDDFRLNMADVILCSFVPNWTLEKLLDHHSI